MGKLTPEETVREQNRGTKAASEGRSRYWSEPWAYPFESDEHYELRRQAFEQGYGDQFHNTAKTRVKLRHHDWQTNRVERSMNGAFCAFWHGPMAYENGWD